MKKKIETHIIDQLFEKFTMVKLSEGFQAPGKTELKVFLRDVGLDYTDDITKVNEELFKKWVVKMRNSKLKGASINHYISAIRTFLYWCMNEGYIKEFKIKLIKVQEETIKYIPDDDLRKLLVKNTSSFSKHRAYMVCCFLLGTGCRASTLVNIRLEDIDMHSKTVSFRHNKNKKAQTVCLSRSLEMNLREYLNTWDLQDYLFPEVNGQQMTVNALKLLLARHCKACGTKVYRPHIWRHTVARRWIVNGGNPFQLQMMLGHSKLDMTKKYCHLFGTDIDMTYNPLDTLKLPTSRSNVIQRRY